MTRTDKPGICPLDPPMFRSRILQNSKSERIVKREIHFDRSIFTFPAPKITQPEFQIPTSLEKSTTFHAATYFSHHSMSN